MLGVGRGPQAKDAFLDIDPSLPTGSIGVSLALPSLIWLCLALPPFTQVTDMSPAWPLRKQIC